MELKNVMMRTNRADQMSSKLTSRINQRQMMPLNASQTSTGKRALSHFQLISLGWVNINKVLNCVISLIDEIRFVRISWPNPRLEFVCVCLRLAYLAGLPCPPNANFLLAPG
jgi:hypothetical protein